MPKILIYKNMKIYRKLFSKKDKKILNNQRKNTNIS